MNTEKIGKKKVEKCACGFPHSEIVEIGDRIFFLCLLCWKLLKEAVLSEVMRDIMVAEGQLSKRSEELKKKDLQDAA